MKIRIKGNSIRLRLSQKEVSALSQGEAIMERTVFSPMDAFEYALESWHLDVAEAKFEKERITVMLPEQAVTKWAGTEEVSLQYTQDNGADGLRILVEKDFACLAEREGEDESDNYPHPNTGNLKC
jgi:hypothetical protein